MFGQHASNLGPFQVNGNGLIHGFQDLDHKLGIHGCYWLQHWVLLATKLALGCTVAGLENKISFFGGTFPASVSDHGVGYLLGRYIC